MSDPAPFRRFGEWRDSDCDRWNADERDEETK